MEWKTTGEGECASFFSLSFRSAAEESASVLALAIEPHSSVCHSAAQRRNLLLFLLLPLRLIFQFVIPQRGGGICLCSCSCH
jgi:hypothetical protein